MGPFVSLLFCLACWLRWSPVDIAFHHNWLLMWGIGLLSCKLNMHIMLSHLCATNLFLMRKTLIPIFLYGMYAFLQCGANVLPEAYRIQPILPESMVAKLLMVLVFVTYCHMVYHVIDEITTILNIKCFKVKPES